jgi:hypothetical protein
MNEREMVGGEDERQRELWWRRRRVLGIFYEFVVSESVAQRESGE